MLFKTALSILVTYHEGFLKGLAVTLHMSAIIWFLGLTLGSALGWAGALNRTWIGRPSRLVSFTLSAVPALVFLFWLHYPAQAMFGVVIDPFLTATFTFTLLNIFGVADIVRGAMEDFPKQFLTSARVCGLTEKQTVMDIQLPILLRMTLPSLLLLQVAMLHMTLFSSLISVEELFRVAQRINASIYKPVEIYTALGFFFLIVCVPVNAFAWWMKKRFTRDLSLR
jgi:His/Glu/Gln/Arg/opine family amino acid ABC transporter permease subunit